MPRLPVNFYVSPKALLLLDDATYSEMIQTLGLPDVLGDDPNAAINSCGFIQQWGGVTAPTNGAYLGADGYIWINNAGSAVVNSQRVLASTAGACPTWAESGFAFPSSLGVNITTNDATLAAADLYTIRQKIEGYRAGHLYGGFTVGFWFKAPTAGTYCVLMQSGDGARCCWQDFTYSSANTWQYIEEEIPAIDETYIANFGPYSNGSGIIFDLVLGAGSNYQGGTAGTWAATGANLAPATISNGLVATGWIYLTGLQIVPTAVTPKFPFRTQDIEHLLCERYYEKSYGVDVNPGTGGPQTNLHQVTATGNVPNQCPGAQFRTVKRTTPAVTIYSPNGTVNKVANTSYVDFGSGTHTALSPHTKNFRGVFNSASDFSGQQYTYHWVADARL